jgi:hypothetical protein
MKNLGRLAAVKRVEMDSGWKMKLQLQIPSSSNLKKLNLRRNSR